MYERWWGKRVDGRYVRIIATPTISKRRGCVHNVKRSVLRFIAKINKPKNLETTSEQFIIIKIHNFTHTTNHSTYKHYNANTLTDDQLQPVNKVNTLTLQPTHSYIHTRSEAQNWSGNFVIMSNEGNIGIHLSSIMERHNQSIQCAGVLYGRYLRFSYWYFCRCCVVSISKVMHGLGKSICVGKRKKVVIPMWQCLGD